MSTFHRLAVPLLTTWVCFGEAMHLAGRNGRLHRQTMLWEYVEAGLLFFHQLSGAEALRMSRLMVKYSDLPMDLGDASLVVAAESRQLTRVFTLDRDFRIYRIHDRTPFEIVP